MTIMNKEEFFIKNFGKDWYALLKEFLLSDEMVKISRIIRHHRTRHTIIPEENSELFFKIFKDVQPSKIKVIVLGQDPYPQEGVYDGYAFSNSNSLDNKVSPSLKNIIKEIERNYPDNLVMDRMDFSYLVNQGVFPINTALSLRAGHPESHLGLWKPFTQEWIKQINTRNDIVWLLWGGKAHNYQHLITNISHKVIKTSHPSPLGATKGNWNIPAFTGSECFKKINEHLKAINKKEIIW